MTLTGISFPFRKDNGEFPARDREADAVRSNVIALFNCERRSRVMRPNLGTDLDRFVFESIDALLLTRLQRSIRETILNGEPRANVVSITFSQQGTALVADILYTVNGVTDTLSVPVGTTKT